MRSVLAAIQCPALKTHVSRVFFMLMPAAAFNWVDLEIVVLTYSSIWNFGEPFNVLRIYRSRKILRWKLCFILFSLDQHTVFTGQLSGAWGQSSVKLNGTIQSSPSTRPLLCNLQSAIGLMKTHGILSNSSGSSAVSCYLFKQRWAKKVLGYVILFYQTLKPQFLILYLSNQRFYAKLQTHVNVVSILSWPTYVSEII